MTHGQATERATVTATKFTLTLNGRKVQTMTAAQKNNALATRINQRMRQAIGNDHNIVTAEDARILRQAELTLQRWAEQECGTSNDRHSVSIERDDDTGKPFRVVRPHENNKSIQDRVAKLAASLGLHFYHQTDPRGASLYVSHQPLTDQNYTDGIACVV